MLDLNGITLIATALVPFVVQFLKRFFPNLGDVGIQLMLGVVSLLVCLAVELSNNPVVSLNDFILRFPAIWLIAQGFYDKLWTVVAPKLLTVISGQK